MSEQAEPSGKARGTVRWFNAYKGYGFVAPDDEGEDLFVHQSSIEAPGFRSLREGEVVEFYVEEGEDGKKKAVQVTGPDGAAPQGAVRRPYQQQYEYDYSAYQGRGYGYGYYPPGPARGAFAYRGRGRGGRHGFVAGVGYAPEGGFYFRGRGGRGRGRISERRPPPGVPGVSSGLQVVVHNLPYDCTWQQLKDSFRDCANVERADVVYDSYGRSRGFGVVRFQSKEDATAAVDKMNNKEVAGRVVTVRIDRFA